MRVSVRAGGVLAASLMASGIAVVVAPAASAATLPCRATISNVYPRQNTTVAVTVKTAPSTKVTTVANYKSTRTTKSAWTNTAGYGRTSYNISRATIGYKVVVKVVVTKGTARGECATYFIPKR